MLNVLMAVIGMTLAYKLYAVSATEPRANTFWRHVVIHKFYIDEIYDFLIVKTLRSLSVIEDKIIDQKGVDGILHVVVSGYKAAGAAFALLQNGKVRFYALYILAGLSILSLLMLDALGGL